MAKRVSKKNSGGHKMADTIADEVPLVTYLVGLINERERKYEQRFDAMEKALGKADDAVKAALLSANATTKDALQAAFNATKDALATANANIATALASIDKRFESVNEFRGQLADQQETFARKVDVDAVIASQEKSVLKAEAATEKRFESVNQFRAQLSDQQNTFARKAESDIRFDALDKKLDTAVGQLQLAKGRDNGIAIAWGVAAIVASVLMGVTGIVVSLLVKHIM